MQMAVLDPGDSVLNKAEVALSSQCSHSPENTSKVGASFS